jgi:DNA modification methylase
MRNGMEIERVPIAQLKPYDKSLRVHNRKKRQKLVALLRRFGQAYPILIDEKSQIIDGHAVVDAMKELGFDEIAAIVVENRTPAEIRALRLAVNRIVEDVEWDQEALRTEFRELLELGFDLDLTGFEAVEIDMTLDIDHQTAAVVEEVTAEEVEPATTAAVVAIGDVWRLGHHLIACGNSQDAALVSQLIGARKAAVVFTDPPYNVKIGGNVSGLGKTVHREFAMASGEMSGEAFTAFLAGFIKALIPILADGAILFACMDWRHLRELLDAGEQNQLVLKNLVVWAKSNAGMGSFYRSQHELVCVFKYGDAPHQNHFELGQHGRSRSNVWNYKGVNSFGKDRMELLGAHPTVKPVALVADALRDVSRRGDIVIDPFLGSGSTLLAAEETGRVCIGIEIDPAYVEVAIKRWQKRTGKDAVNTVTGEAFQAAVERHDALQKTVCPPASGTTSVTISPAMPVTTTGITVPMATTTGMTTPALATPATSAMGEAAND